MGILYIMPKIYERVAMYSKSTQNLLDKLKNISVLYIEDDVEVRNQTAKMLKLLFRKVIDCANGHIGLSRFTKEIGLIFTDINMPGINGLELIEKIREKNQNIPIIIFSAYDNPKYLLKAIELDTQGYLLKPFVLEELLRVLKNVIKQDKETETTIKLFDNFLWHKNSSSLYKNNIKIKLTAKEIELLKLLLSYKEKIFSSQEIEVELYSDDICDNKRVRNLITRFRKKVGHSLIENIYGAGYRLKWES